jgi:fucose 4-O-acetylase-like acetyltransferase
MDNILAKKQLDNCYFVKTVLMIVIVFYHSILFWSETWLTEVNPIFKSKTLAVIASWLNSFHVYAFTLVSGYIFYFLKNEKRKYDEFTPFLYGKIKRLIVPYIFVCIAWVIPIGICISNYTLSDIMKKYLLATAPSQLWFLWMLFWVFIFAYFLNNIINKGVIISVIVALFSYGLALIGLMLNIPNVFCILRSLSFFTFFIIGMKLRQYNGGILNKIPVVVYVFVDISLFAIYKIIDSYEGIVFKLLSVGLKYALNICGAIAAFYILQLLANKINWKDNIIFRELSSKSMPMYLFHQQIIYFTIMIFNGRVNPYINSLLNFVIAIVLSFGISYFMMKFKVTRFLIGEKNK